MAYIPNLMTDDHWHVLACVNCKVRSSLSDDRHDEVIEHLREWELVNGDRVTEQGQNWLEADGNAGR